MEKIRADGDRVVFMIHYPPFNARFEDSEVTELMNKHNVDAVVYGHIHGKDCRAKKLVRKSGIPYYLTSCDQVRNTAVKIEFWKATVKQSIETVSVIAILVNKQIAHYFIYEV